MAGSRVLGWIARPTARIDAPDQGGPDLHEDGNLRAVQLLLGHTKLESTVCYLGIEVDDALVISEQVEL